MRTWGRYSCSFCCFVLVVSCITAGTFEFGAPSAFAQSSDVSQKQIQSFLSAPLPGNVTPEEAPAFYKADSLYEYIDGGADVYLLYDFRVLLHRDFKSGSSEVTADIYEMGKMRRRVWYLCGRAVPQVQVRADRDRRIPQQRDSEFCSRPLLREAAGNWVECGSTA